MAKSVILEGPEVEAIDSGTGGVVKCCSRIAVLSSQVAITLDPSLEKDTSGKQIIKAMTLVARIRTSPSDTFIPLGYLSKVGDAQKVQDIKDHYLQISIRLHDDSTPTETLTFKNFD